MTAVTKSYRWTKIKNGIGNVATVSISVIENSCAQNKIAEHYSGLGFTSQGNIEEVPPRGYNSWKLAARKGLEYAFSLTDTYWTVNIYKIEGISTNTNPAIVGYTIIRAFFDKINFQLDNKQIDVLEEFVLRSWEKPYKVRIPNFSDLTFSEFTD